MKTIKPSQQDNIMKNTLTKSILGLSLCAMLLPINASGQELTRFSKFTDEFDGPIDDDNPVTWQSVGWGTISSSDGLARITDPFQLPGFSIGLASVWKDGQRMESNNVSAQAVIRVSDPWTWASL